MKSYSPEPEPTPIFLARDRRLRRLSQSRGGRRDVHHQGSPQGLFANTRQIGQTKNMLLKSQIWLTFAMPKHPNTLFNAQTSQALTT